MTHADEAARIIAMLRARRMTENSITRTELMVLVEAYEKVAQERDGVRADLDSLTEDAAKVVRLYERREYDDALDAVSSLRDNGLHADWWKP